MPSIISNPTFKAKVTLTKPGGETYDVEIEFIHKTKQQVKELNEKIDAAEQNSYDVDALMEIVKDWGFDEEFNKENVIILDQNDPIACRDIYVAYLNEVMGFRRKN